MDITRIVNILTPMTAASLCTSAFLVFTIVWIKVDKFVFNGKYLKCITVLGSFLLLLQFSQTFMDFDDFGYVALSYASPSFDVIGRNYSLLDIVRYLIEHYINWGGRILYFFIEIVLLKESVWLFRIAESLLIIIWMYVVSRKITQNNSKQISLVLFSILVLYGVLEIELMRDGVYWYSASILYVFPLLPLTCLVFDYISTIEKHGIQNSLLILKMGGLAFIASFSQEQISTAVVGVVSLIIIYKIIKKIEVNRIDFVVLICSGIGFILLLLCPGSLQRNSLTQTPLFERIGTNIQLLDYLLFGSPNIRLFMVAFFLAAGMIAFMLVQKERISRLHYLFAILSGAVGVAWLLGKSPVYFMNALPIFATVPSEIKTILRMLFICMAFSYFVVYCHITDRNEVCLLLVASLLSIVPGLIAPGISMRMMVPFCFLLLPSIAVVFSDGIYSLRIDNSHLYCIMVVATMGVIVWAGVYNFQTILCGYSKNAAIRVSNNMVLENISKDDKAEIHLRKLVDDRYANIQPYHDGYSFIEDNIREYYDLSKETRFVWE